MPFQKGHKLSPGGKKGNKGGRPSKESKKIATTAAEIAREFIEKNVKPVLDSYLGLAKGRWVTRRTLTGAKYREWVVDAATTRHFVDKLVPAIKPDDSEPDEQARPVYFIQFNAVNGAVQLPAAPVSNPILVSNGNGHQERGEGVASEIRQGQNGLEFHSFANVSRKRG